MAPPTNCQLCSAKPFKYQCPRCNICYCSVVCYKSPAHAPCSETFYKECVVQEMAVLAKKPNAAVEDVSALNGDVRKMYEILKRMDMEQDDDEISEEDVEYDGEEELDSDDEEIGIDMADRLQNVDLNDANAVWSQLTEAERQEFENIVHSDDISNLIEILEPWWTQKTIKPLIEEITPNATKKPTETLDIPPVFPNITEFAQLSTKPAAPCLRHNIVNVLAAYTITFRYFNGEHLASSEEACSFLMAISGALRVNANYDDDQMAIDVVINDCATEHVTLEDGQDALVRADVQAILGGPDGDSHLYTLAALSDVHRLLLVAKKAVANGSTTLQQGAVDKDGTAEFSKRFMDHQSVNRDWVNRSKLAVVAKKLEFFLAFVKSGWKG